MSDDLDLDALDLAVAVFDAPSDGKTDGPFWRAFDQLKAAAPQLIALARRTEVLEVLVAGAEVAYNEMEAARDAALARCKSLSLALEYTTHQFERAIANLSIRDADEIVSHNRALLADTQEPA